MSVKNNINSLKRIRDEKNLVFFIASISIFIFAASATYKLFFPDIQKLIEEYNVAHYECGLSSTNLQLRSKHPCDKRTEIEKTLNKRGWSLGCQGEPRYLSHWRNDCRIQVDSKSNNAIESVKNYFMKILETSSEAPIEISFQYVVNMGTIIEIQSRIDELILLQVKSNRGKCDSEIDTAMKLFGQNPDNTPQLLNNFFGTPGLFRPKLPSKLNFGDIWSENYPCKVIEIDVKTNHGEWRLPLKYND